MNLILYKANGEECNDLESISLAFFEPMYELWGKYITYWPSIICKQDDFVNNNLKNGWMTVGGIVIFK